MGWAVLSGAFPTAGSELLLTEIHDGTVTIVGHASSSNNLWNLVIPADIGGLPVVAIRSEAFANCDTLESLTISSPVREIGDNAFTHCTRLTNVLLPDSLTLLGRAAFADCTSLASIRIGPRLQRIGSSAFIRCHRLSDIQLPESLTDIGFSAFYQCTSLREVTLPPFLGDLSDHLFGQCSGLQILNLPKGIRSLPLNVVNGCTSLERIQVDPANPHLASIDGVLLSPDHTTVLLFPFHRGGTYEIPEGVTSVGDGSFFGHTGLTNIIFPSSLVALGDAAFRNCPGLTRAYFRGDRPSFGFSTFSAAPVTFYFLPETSGWSFSIHGRPAYWWGPRGETRFVYSHVDNTIGITGWTTALADLVIPPTIDGLPVTRIADRAFLGKHELKTVSIANSVTHIGIQAFAFCDSLTEVKLPESILVLGAGAFFDCYSLPAISLPASLAAISSTTFSRCSSLTQVTFREGLLRIGESEVGPDGGAFEKCVSLQDVVLPQSLRSIRDRTFASCSSLATVNLGGVQTVGLNAFADCPRLTRIVFPSSITRVSDTAFSGSSAIQAAYFYGARPTINASAFAAPPPVLFYLPGSARWNLPAPGFTLQPWLPDLRLVAQHTGPAGTTVQIQSSWARGKTVVIESATALDPGSLSWIRAVTNTLQNETVEVRIEHPDRDIQRFYRLREHLPVTP